MATSQLFNFSSYKYSDSLTVVGISFCTAIVCEAISWLLIYRTNSYKSLRSSIDKAAKKLETMKTETPNSSSSSVAKVKISNKKSKTKKIDRVETSLKQSSRDLSLIKFKSGAVVALVLFIVFGLLNSLFEGKVVAKLPFKPFGIFMKMSHRGLHGDDVINCLMPFLFQVEGRETMTSFPLNVFFFFFFLNKKMQNGVVLGVLTQPLIEL